MARVFISYARPDSELATEVHGWLVAAGHEAFLDQDRADGIRPGEDWQERLYERLRWADAVVCLVSAASVDSTWCVGEVTTALSRGSRLIPIQIEADVDHPLLIRIQHVNLDCGIQVLRVRLLDELRLVDAAGGSGWPDDRSPFPGLRPFDTNQHRVFFGRSSEVAQLAALLRSPAERREGGVLLVVGPSGCGKSSLVRAGLLPAIAIEPGWWVVAPMLPGIDPVAALTRELAAGLRAVGCEVTVAEVGSRLDRDGLAGVVDELLLAAPSPRRTRLLLVIDQFEELLTQSSPVERSRFAELLASAVPGALQVVATLRPEFFDQLLLDCQLAGLGVGRRPFAVRPLVRDVLPEVIEKPARLAGIDVDEGLVTQLVADTEGGEALPLLAYTLAQLADGVGRGGRLLGSRYEQLGGVHGALTRQADAALAEAMTRGGRGRHGVLRELLQLVTVDEQGRPTRWRVPRAELPDAAFAVVEPFVDRRLLITDSDGGGDVVEVAHEAILSAWAPLATVIAENVTALRSRRRIEQAATEWAEQGRPAGRLWERGQLASALADTGARFVTPTTNDEAGTDRSGQLRWRPHRYQALVTDRVELSRSAREFLHAGFRLDRSRRRRSTMILSTLLVLALLSAGVAVVLQRLATQQQRAASEQARIALAGQLAAVSATKRASALDLAGLLAVQAYVTDPTVRSRAALLGAATSAGQLVRYLPLQATVGDVAVSKDGSTVVAGLDDGTVWLWRTAEQAPELLAKMQEPVLAVAASANADIVAAGSETSLMVNRPGSEPHVIGGKGLGSNCALTSDCGFTLSDSGRTLVITLDDSEGEWVDVLKIEADAVRDLGRKPGSFGGRAVTTDDEALVLDLRSGTWERHRLSDWSLLMTGAVPISNGFLDAQIAADSESIILAEESAPHAGVWRTDEPTPPTTDDWVAPYSLQAPIAYPNAVALSPDGTNGAVADTGSIYVGPVARSDETRATATQLVGVGSIDYSSIRFLGKNRLIASSGSRLILWDLTAIDRLATVASVPIDVSCHACGPPEVAVSPDGRFAFVLEGNREFGELVNLRDLTTQGDRLRVRDYTYQGSSWTRSGSLVFLVSDHMSGDAPPPPVKLLHVDGEVRAAGGGPGDSDVVAIMVDGRVLRFDAATGAAVELAPAVSSGLASGMEGDGDMVAAVGPTGLAAFTRGTIVTAVDPQSGKLSSRDMSDSVTAVAVAGARILVRMSDASIRVFDATLSRLERMIPGDATGSDFYDPVVSPTGRLIAQAREDSSVRLVDVDSGTELTTFRATSPGLRTGIGFTSDDGTIVTATQVPATADPAVGFGASGNGMLVSRLISDDALIRSACAMAGRDLTQEEWFQAVNAPPPQSLACPV